jgi:hypothetical protein
VINDLQPADVAARRKSMPGRRSFGRFEARLTPISTHIGQQTRTDRC